MPVTKTRIPAQLISVVSEVMAESETHATLDSLFMYADAPGDPPEGSKLTKAQEWLRRINKDDSLVPLNVIGHLIEGYMEADCDDEFYLQRRQKLEKSLKRAELQYVKGGSVVGAVSSPAKMLEEYGVDEGRKRLAKGVSSKKKPVVEEELSQKESDKKIIESQSIMTNYVQINKNIWKEIQEELGISKIAFGRKIKFVKDPFKREIVFRDIGHAYLLAKYGFFKPAVILAGSVIEELLRLFLHHKKISPAKDTFDEYIRACEKADLLKSGIQKLTDSVRHFRNLVHLEKEKTKKHSISKATAKGAVASIITLVNDF